jgi:hypothetical protein
MSVTFAENSNASYVTELIIYDVGGSRTQRHQWLNYFDDGEHF